MKLLLGITGYSLLLFLMLEQGFAQSCGCTDPLAKNFQPFACKNDGSCRYRRTTVKPIKTFILNDSLSGTSGLIFWNNRLFTQNDHGDNNLYSLNPENGTILEKFPLIVSSVGDWEEVSQDSTFIYLGDFGNNRNGNRRDLHILRIPKHSFGEKKQNIDSICFSYSDQTDFDPTGPDHTNFDCEAFIVTQDSIYLFTKQWITKKTSVYVLPKIPGYYLAAFRGSFNVNGLITGATYLETKHQLTLCGYSSLGKPFLLLLYDFSANEFFSGNKRKLRISQFISQNEGISTKDGRIFFLTNEKLKFLVTFPPRLQVLDLSRFTDACPHRSETNNLKSTH